MSKITKLLIGSIIAFFIINLCILFLKIGKNDTDHQLLSLYWGQKQINNIKEQDEYKLWNPSFYYGTDSITTYSFQDRFDKPVLIFYFSIESCQPCLDAIVETLKDSIPNYATNENILLFSDDLEWRLRNSFLDKKIINTKSYSQPLSFIENKVPTLFLLDPQTSLIHHIFPYNKETPDYLNDYLHIIKKRFFPT